MVRQNHIKAAYGKVGSHGKRRCWLAAGILVMIFVLLNGGGRREVQNEQNLRSSHQSESQIKFENHDETNLGSSIAYRDHSPDLDDINAAVTQTVAEIEDAEEEELEKSETMLSTSLKSAGNMLRVGMGSLLGNTMSSTEMEEVAEEVESKLEAEYTMELQSLADGIREQEVDMIDNMVQEEEDAGYTTERIETDIQRGEMDAVAAVREGIDQAASEIQTSMQTRALELEKQILEQRLSMLLQKKVTLIIEEDHLEATEELLQGLEVLRAPHNKPAEASGYSSYSSGSSTSSYLGSSNAVLGSHSTISSYNNQNGYGAPESSFSENQHGQSFERGYLEDAGVVPGRDEALGEGESTDDDYDDTKRNSEDW